MGSDGRDVSVDPGSGGAIGTGGSSGPDGADVAADGSGDLGGADVGTGGSGPPPAVLTGDGCAGGTCRNPTCAPLGSPVAVGIYPTIGFEEQPQYIPRDVIVPTFDDAPDGAIDPTSPDAKIYGAGLWTENILGFLHAKNLHVDFFINTNNWCGDVTMDSQCIATLTDILTTQNPGNHTVHHVHMGMELPPFGGVPQGCGGGATSQPTCDDEITGVERLVATMTAGGRSHLTRFRAPYGEPYQNQGPGLSVVQPVVAKYAVQVGWNMDSGDFTCDTTLGVPCFSGQQIADNVIRLIGTAPGQRYGVLLMHATFPWTKDGVPILFDPTTGFLATHNFKLATVEDVICWKYGKHSWQIVQELTGQARGPN